MLIYNILHYSKLKNYINWGSFIFPPIINYRNFVIIGIGQAYTYIKTSQVKNRKT